jgi:hypothetical protein
LRDESARLKPSEIASGRGLRSASNSRPSARYTPRIPRSCL